MSFFCRARTATFTLTNSVPEDACFNRIVWFHEETALKIRMEERCAFSGANRFVIAGAVPSEAIFIPQRDLVVEDQDDRVPERVNVPSYVWRASCCDASDSRDPNAKSFFHGVIGENRAGGSLEEFTDMASLTRRLEGLYNYNTSLTILADACQSSTADVIG